MLDAHVSSIDKMSLYCDTHLRHNSQLLELKIYIPAHLPHGQETGLIPALEYESTDWECI